MMRWLTPARRTIDVATASVGLTTAPRAMAAASPSPGTSVWRTVPTTTAESATSSTDRVAIGPRLRRNSGIGILTAEAWRSPGRMTSRMMSGSACMAGTAGIAATPVPRTRSSTGATTPARSADRSLIAMTNRATTAMGSMTDTASRIHAPAAAGADPSTARRRRGPTSTHPPEDVGRTRVLMRGTVVSGRWDQPHVPALRPSREGGPGFRRILLSCGSLRPSREGGPEPHEAPAPPAFRSPPCSAEPLPAALHEGGHRGSGQGQIASDQEKIHGPGRRRSGAGAAPRTPC